MISLEEFKDYLLFIRGQRVKEEAFMEVLESLNPDNHCECWLYDQYEEKLIELLEKELNVQDDSLRAFVWDLNGLHNKSLVIENIRHCPTDADGNVLFYSADTLYEYLTRYQK